MISLRDVTVAYGSQVVLDGVDLDICDGETLAILGASGSGKSTILRLIIGLQKPTRGRIFVDGADITPYDEEQLNEMRRNMGMVFQYSALFDSMTVGENVAFGPRQRTRCSEEEIQAIVREKLSLVGLEGIEDMMPNDLSGGMKKRVSLARAIALDPKTILYDEPTAGLDPLRSMDINRLIVGMQRRASICSVTFIVPSSAVMAAPTRPATTTPVRIGPSSRPMAIDMTPPKVDWAPYRSRISTICRVITMPAKRRVRLTMGRELTPR